MDIHPSIHPSIIHREGEEGISLAAMSPPRTYRAGMKDIHFHAHIDRYKEFEELCRKEGKSPTEKFNEFINRTLETDCIGEPESISISILGYSPTPAQQKISSFTTASAADDPTITITNPAKVLDLIRDNGVIGILYWEQTLEQLDNAEHLQKCITFGNTLRLAADKRLNEVKAEKRIEGKAARAIVSKVK